MSELIYFLKIALNHLRRNPGVASVTIGTIALVFFIMGVFFLITHNLTSVGDRLAAGLQLVVFLEDDCSRKQKQELQGFFSSYSGSKLVRFVDRAEATSRFRDRLGDQAYLLNGLEDNPLPESYEITFKPDDRTLERISALAGQVAKMPGVEEVQYGKAWLERFFEFTKMARGLGWLIGIFVFLVAMLVVSNTIRLSVYARQDEINVLKLVGATNGFVKGPFYVEGMIFGLLGAFLGMVITYFVFMILVPDWVVPRWLGSKMVTLDFLSFTEVTRMVAAGAMLGLIGTATSMWRYLKKR